MQNYKQPGDILTLTAPYACASGEGAQVGSIFGVATNTVASGATGEFKTEGVIELKKTSAQAWTVGLKLYWDNTAKEVTSTVGSNLAIGVATAAAANPSPTGLVRLNGSF